MCIRDSSYGDNPTLRFELELSQPIENLVIGLALVTKDGSRIFTSHSNDDLQFKLPNPANGKFTIDTRIDLPSLSPGVYDIIFGIKDKNHDTLIYSEDEIVLELNYIRKEKDGDEGLLWHTTNWQYRTNVK